MSDTIANRLRTLRMEHEISREKLAEVYAEYFSVSVDWILYGKEYGE